MATEEGTTLTPGAQTPEGAAAAEGTTLTPPAEGTTTPPAEGTTTTPPKEEGATAPKPGEEGAPTGAPENYETFTLPEGYTLEGARAETFQTFAKTNDWSQKQAQEAVDLYMQMQSEDVANADAAWDAQKADWTAAIKADDELGGDDHDQKAGIAAAAVAKYGTDALREYLLKSGAGNHPELVRAFYRAGLPLQEDGMPAGGAASPPAGTPASVLYPNDTPSKK